MNTPADYCQSVSDRGFAIVDRYLDLATVKCLIDDLTALNINPDRAGVRDLLALVPSVRHLADSQELRSLLPPILGTEIRAVRGIFFDKQPSANWKVPWHQDLSIAVRSQLELPGYHPWSTKAGVPHVQPPAEILEQMLTVRIHLDRTDPNNGVLKVIPGSHHHGKLTQPQVETWKRSPSIDCNCDPGGILLMRPLLLHASSMAIVPSHRRVIHLEYAACQLPSGLEWYY
jgi:hypothetical protein